MTGVQTCALPIFICNPPFFENQLESAKKGNNLAKHSSELKREDLLAVVIDLLKETGIFYVLLPPAESVLFKDLALLSGLYLSKIVRVSNFVNSPFIRVMMAFQKQKSDLEEEEIYIYSDQKIYAEPFSKLLKDYYLYL